VALTLASKSTSVTLSAEGVIYRTTGSPMPEWYLEPDASSADADIVAFIAQLEELGYAVPQADQAMVVAWPSVYRILEADDFVPPERAFPIPSVDATVVPSLTSSGSLSDHRFRIEISGWFHDGNRRLADRLDLTGPVRAGSDDGRPFILSETVFAMVDAIRSFQQLERAERTPDRNRLAWGKIRELALASGAVLDQFLRTTIVLRPTMLGLGLERVQVGEDVAVRVTPTFDGAPRGWIESFDRSRRAQPTYKIVDQDGSYTEVIAEPEVLDVLSEIKRLPGRMVAGERARQFIENPIAFFGGDHAAVFDEHRIEVELESLRADSWAFRPKISLDDVGGVVGVAVELERQGADRDSETSLRLFSSPAGLDMFVRPASTALEAGHEFFTWRGLEIEIGPHGAEYVEVLRQVLHRWGANAPAAPDADVQPGDGTLAAPGFVIDADMVLDLSRYYDRIDSIGIETPYGIVSIPLNRKGAWLREDQDIRLLIPDGKGGTVAALEMDREALGAFVRSVARATTSKHDTVVLPAGGLMPLGQAQDLVDALPRTLVEEVAPEHAVPKAERQPPRGRVGLLIKPNIDNEDYVASRDDALRAPDGAVALLPAALRAGVQLKQHQVTGLLWLQHLYTQSPTTCRGALLADDMGLGKTLQALALIARAREDDPDLPPALVVAPVTLLENWIQETDRFFQPGSLPLLTLYGPELKSFRVRKSDIDERLRTDGLRKFLRPGWQDGAAVVLTTYETLRDYEFSFGDVTWSIVVCDEAQRIKNPNALMTRAAKKLNARFCVAATGTPVENNLTDLWSLFDFIQPGLLEPLNRFNRNYRRPIESKTAAQVARLDELRRILRRTKRDVARDLPDKLFEMTCRELPMSARQRELYDAVVVAQRLTSDAQQSGTDILQLISTLRRICTDPRSSRELGEPLPSLVDYRRVSPKLDWLMTTLQAIRDQHEKAIVFLDRKDIQRLVQAYIREQFGFSPQIINGDTPTGAASPDSRQKRIDRFQATEGFSVLILSPVAAGVGLNIQKANHVIHYMRHWNPAKEDQATDRAYRIGQDRDVHVYTPIVRGDGWVSFDERLDELLDKKRSIASDILNGADDVGAAEFADLLA
jgi:hypothetical protein